MDMSWTRRLFLLPREMSLTASYIGFVTAHVACGGLAVAVSRKGRGAGCGRRRRRHTGAKAKKNNTFRGVFESPPRESAPQPAQPTSIITSRVISVGRRGGMIRCRGRRCARAAGDPSRVLPHTAPHRALRAHHYYFSFRPLIGPVPSRRHTVSRVVVHLCSVLFCSVAVLFFLKTTMNAP